MIRHLDSIPTAAQAASLIAQGVEGIVCPFFKGEHDFENLMDFTTARLLLEANNVTITVANLED